jgi:hypothetical protein
VGVGSATVQADEIEIGEIPTMVRQLTPLSAGVAVNDVPAVLGNKYAMTPAAPEAKGNLWTLP